MWWELTLAVAEFFAGCKGKYHSIMAVILGTGVGSGLVLNDRLYRGTQGGGGEIGHMTIDMHGRICECGRHGCVEAYLSGPSHSRRFFDLCNKKLQVQDIYKLCQEQNPHMVHGSASALGDSAGVFGAAYLALRELGLIDF